ncbi:cytochrome o ubiquinol oxidase subunit IV [Sphingomonas radiodurans]|uniref:cytochrome o ubiquinol oxidase subunit IV n=1 Tax=Sphingomonas radiodurans TaxID=2890321 RepID=UPI001E4CAF37|nr:cytochrome o ubiquinol oxidase subunit IV [Sphingomonas radiodurans]WBH17230.1 cytochrome o ubiquinol oxidase subunit IV [Sphingomonas radiodurans]
MSAHQAQNAPAPDGGHGHGSRRGYVIGFLLSAVLTAIPFWLVMSGVLADRQITAILVIALALVQIVVHTYFFLHVNPRAEGGWTLMALIFTVVIVTIVIAGSLWIMYHLNNNMMPMSGDMAGM